VPLTTLPNGLVLEAPSAAEAKVIYRELFEACPYLRNGVTVRPGDTILDIGANVGGFSVLLAGRYRDLRIVAFEPIPETFAILERNASRLLAGADVTLVNAGVSSAAGRARFEIPPNSSFMASAEPAPPSPAMRGAGSPLVRARALLEDAERAGLVPRRVTRRLAAGLDSRLARPFLLAGMRVGGRALSVLRRMRTRHVDCEMTTVSDCLRKYGIDVVDLVKIDVEGAEWSVLNGIGDDDWTRLRQLAIEVHDVDGRVGKVRELLERKGYRVVVEQEDWATLKLLGLHNVYAVRSDRTGVDM
jgi:FkbM family methyltransferase